MAASTITARPPARPALLVAAPTSPPVFPLGGPHLVRASVAEAFALAFEAVGEDAVVVRHELGHPAEVSAGEHPVIEDCTEAIGAWSERGPVGSVGDVAVFALGPTLGLRGAVVCGSAVADREDVAPDRRARAIAAVLPGLAHPSFQSRRLGHHLALAAALGDRVPERFRDPSPGAAPLVVPLEVEDADAELTRLRAQKIHAVRLGDRLIGLPCHHHLTPEDVERVAVAVEAPRGAAPAKTSRGAAVETSWGAAAENAPGEAPAKASRNNGVRHRACTVEPLGDFSAARGAWAEVPNANLFTTIEWAETWWRHFGGDRPLHLLACRDAGETVGILPLYRAARRPVDLVRFVGHGPADRIAPVCAPEDRVRVAAALRDALGELRPDLLVADELPADEGWAGLLGGVTLRREPSPVLPAAGLTFDAFLASRSRNFREQVRRRERALRKRHDVAFRLVTDPADLDAALTTLHALHEARWQGASNTFAEGPARAFQRDFARVALERGWLRLWLLEVDGVAVAAWQGFRYAEYEWYYQSGRDPAWDKQSVGFVLLSHTVRAAMDDGVREYRLLRGGEEYKGRFSAFDPGLEVLAVPRTTAGLAATAAGLGVRAVPPDVRRALLRRAG